MHIQNFSRYYLDVFFGYYRGDRRKNCCGATAPQQFFLISPWVPEGGRAPHMGPMRGKVKGIRCGKSHATDPLRGTASAYRTIIF